MISVDSMCMLVSEGKPRAVLLNKLKLSLFRVPVSRDSKSLQLSVERLVVLEAQQSCGLDFDPLRFFHRTPQVFTPNLVEMFFQIEVISECSICEYAA